MKSEFEYKLIRDCHVRLTELEDEQELIKEFLKTIDPKVPRKPRTKPRRETGEAMAELDAHRGTRLQVVTQVPLNRDEARKLVAGDVEVAAQT